MTKIATLLQRALCYHSLCLTGIEVFFVTQQLENGGNSQQLADFQLKLATITTFNHLCYSFYYYLHVATFNFKFGTCVACLAATCNNYLQPTKIRVKPIFAA